LARDEPRLACERCADPSLWSRNMRRGVHVAIAVLFVACGHPADPGPACVDLSVACRPLHDPPTYSVIYSTIFQPTCAAGLSTCHSPDAKKAGLFFEDPAQAYRLLLGMADGRARVLPNDPGCSLLAERVESKDPNFRMPPGTGLMPAEL